MPETSSNLDSKAHALLIGVADYSSFCGNDGPKLKGSLNDVVLLAYYCMGVLGIPAKNIRVLTTPKMDMEDFKTRMIPEEIKTNDRAHWCESLDEVELGEATEVEVKLGLAGLLAAAKESDAAALFAFSGHGAWSSKPGPLLCLGDTTPEFTRGVLALKTLGDDIKKAGVRDKVIALLDCCHVAASRVNPRLHGKSLPHPGTAEDIAGHQDLFNVSDRVLLGAHPGREAFQVCLGGMWHGALTFAVVTAAERWRADDQMSHGSYRQVLKRAKLTLEVLDVPQKPEFWVAIRQSPFLGVKLGPTRREPDAAQEGVQLDPDFRYEIYVDDTDRPMAIIVATGTTNVFVNGSPTPLPLKTESWYVNPDALSSLRAAASLTIKETVLGSSVTIDSVYSQKFSKPEVTTWSQPLALPSDGINYSFSGAPATPSSVTAYVVLTIPTSGALTLKHVQWYLPVTPSDDVFNPGDSSGIRYSTTTSTPPSTYSGAPSL